MVGPPPLTALNSHRTSTIQREWQEKDFSLEGDAEKTKGFWNGVRTSKAEFYVPDPDGHTGTLYVPDNSGARPVWRFSQAFYGSEHTAKMAEIKGKAEAEAAPAEPNAPQVQLKKTTIDHILEGGTKSSGSRHTGLHSTKRIKDKTVSFDPIHPPDENGVYSAIVQLQGFKDAKGSFFFPDAWSEDRILQEIAFAWSRRQKLKSGAVHWSGPTTIDGMFIGGLGGQDKIDDLETAFPSYHGDFPNPNTIDAKLKKQHERAAQDW